MKNAPAARPRPPADDQLARRAPEGRPARLLPCLSLLLLALALSRASSAAIINVPVDQPTLRAAVQAAVSGDVVLIAPGTYDGGIFVDGKSVTFASWFYTTSDTAYIAQTIISGVVGDVCAGDPDCRADAVLEFGPDAGGAVIGLTVTNGLKGIRSGSVVDITYCHVIGTQDGTNYTNGGGGTFSNSLFAYNSDDGVDINGTVNVRVVNNIIRDNDDDGLEFRMYPHTGPLLITEISGNVITGNREDGIQFIDYSDSSSRLLRVERNLFRDNAKVGVSVIAAGPTDTSEDYGGPAMPEHLFVFNNTFVGEHYGIVGGANAVVLNNIFTGTEVSALRRVGVNSIASHNLFWNGAGVFEESNVDLTTSLLVDPLLAADHTLLAGSPAIDAGTASFQWQGQTVLDMQPASYLGSAPDMGVF